MGIKRVLKGGSKPPPKHKYNLRSKSKCDQFDLKNFDLRFPHLTSKILSELNPKSLITFSKVDRYLCGNVENQRIYWIRRIQSKSNNYWHYVSQNEDVELQINKDLYITDMFKV